MTNRLPRKTAMSMQLGLCTLLIFCVLLVAGCGAIKFIAVQAAPTTEKVAPEFNRLPARTVLVYVWAPPEILWDYPKVRLDLAANVSAYLQQNVKDITVVPPLRVESYLEKSHSFEMDPVDVGKHFRADMVVHLAIYQFSMRDQGFAHFYQGRISSSVVVHDLSRPDQPPERIPLREVIVAVPEDHPVGFANIRPEQLRQATYEVFAVEVGKKFHEYERPVD